MMGLIGFIAQVRLAGQSVPKGRFPASVHRGREAPFEQHRKLPYRGDPINGSLPANAGVSDRRREHEHRHRVLPVALLGVQVRRYVTCANAGIGRMQVHDPGTERLATRSRGRAFDPAARLK